VSAQSLTSLVYDASDYDFLSRSLGFADKNRDGSLTQREIRSQTNDAFRDFYATNLSTEEKSILASFSNGRILSARLFSYEPELDAIALKQMRWREHREIIAAHGLPERLDANSLDFDLSRGAGHVFDTVTVDLAEIKRDLEPAYWNALMKDDPACFKTNTVRVLRHLIRLNSGVTDFTVTYSEWERAYGMIVGCLVNGDVDSAESTWNEMLLMWQKSDTDWHVVVDVADWVHSVVDGGIARVGRPDMKIGAAGIRRYVQFPREYVFPVPAPAGSEPRSPLKRATIRTESSWPSATKIPLQSGLGIALNLDVDPGATVSAYQDVKGGSLPFSVGKPLVRLDGFHLNVDAQSGFMRKASGLADRFMSLFGKTFDVESLTGVAVTVFHNRLCLVVQGECNDADLVKPVGCDHLFFDIGFLVRSELDSFDPSGATAAELFDAAGNVYEAANLADLQAAVIAALRKHSSPTGSGALGKALPLKNWKHKFYAENVEADLSSRISEFQRGFAADNEGIRPAVEITHLGVENGKIFGEGTIPSAFTAQGQFDLALGLKSGSARIGDGLLKFPVEFHLSTAKKAGYARITLPETAVKNLGAAWDSTYRGEILIGLTLTEGEFFENGDVSLEKLLSLVNAHIFVDLQKNRSDFLVAAFELSKIETAPETLKLEKLIVDYDLALAGDRNRLYGVIHDGRISVLKRHDHNLYLTHEIAVEAETALTGGVVNLFGKGAVVAISQDEAGVYHLKPAFKSLNADVSGRTKTENLAGEILITPPSSPNQTYKIELIDLAVDVPDAEIVLSGAVARGRTRATVSGIWHVAAKDLVSLFNFDGEWRGAGTLKLKSSGTALEVTATKATADASARELDAEIAIESLRFAPFSARGRSTVKISDADFTLETPLIDIQTDVSGRVTAKGRVPLVSFVAKGANRALSAILPELPTPSLAPGTIRQSFDELGYLNEILRPLIEQIRGTPSSPSDLDFFVSRDFPYEAAAASLNDVNFSMGKLPLAYGAEYESRRALGGKETASYPLFHGLLSFLNPRIERGSFLRTESVQALAADGRLHDFKISLNNPIRFLGFRLNGIGIAATKDVLGARERNHVYIFTERGRIDLMTLLRLRFPCKMHRLYRNLRAQGVKLAPNEIPSELTDVAKYFEEVLKVFNIDTAIRENVDYKTKPIQAAEFADMTRKQALGLWDALKSLGLPQPMPKTAGKSSLLAYVNAAALNPELSSLLRPHVGLFAPPDQGWAEDYLDEIDLLKFEAGGDFLSANDKARVIANHYRLMHLFVAPFLPHVDYLDFNRSEDLSLDAPDAVPKRADYGIIEVREDAAAPLDISISYNPTDSQEHLEHPGFYAALAMQDGDAIKNVGFNYKTPTLWFKSEFERIDGLEYYLGRSTPEHAANFEVTLHGYDTQNVEATYMPPSPFNRPAFSIFSPEGTGAPVGNHFAGQRFQVGQFDDDLTVRIGIDEGSADNTFVYFYLGDDGKERDILIDASEAAVAGVDSEIVVDYDKTTGLTRTSVNKVEGNIVLDTLPDGKPRALLYLGTTPGGARRYLTLNNLESKGHFDIENDSLFLQAHIGFLATLPDSIYDSPITHDLRSKGVDFKIEAIRLDGTMDFKIDEESAGFTQSPRSKGELIGGSGLTDTGLSGHMHDDDITLTLYGSFRFNVNGSWVTLTDITVPLDSMLLKLVSEQGLNDITVSRVLLETLKIPAGRPLTAGVDMNIDTAPRSTTGDIRIQDGTLSLSTDSPFEFHMTDEASPGFSTLGAHLSIVDSQNRLDLSSGQITYRDGDGTVKNWNLEGEVKDQIYRLIVDVALKGHVLNFQGK
jgi:hypothetical protein